MEFKIIWRRVELKVDFKTHKKKWMRKFILVFTDLQPNFVIYNNNFIKKLFSKYFMKSLMQWLLLSKSQIKGLSETFVTCFLMLTFKSRNLSFVFKIFSFSGQSIMTFNFYNTFSVLCFLQTFYNPFTASKLFEKFLQKIVSIGSIFGLGLG